MSTFGPRFGGEGYQFPRTHSAHLHRGKPIRSVRLANDAHVQITPLQGPSREKLWEVSATWQEGNVTHLDSVVVRDELEASVEWARFLRKLQP